MATNPGYYVSMLEQSKDKYTLATDEIERDLHRSVLNIRLQVNMTGLFSFLN